MRRMSKIAIIAVAAVVLGAALVAALALVSSARAQTDVQAPAAAERTITVTGQGRVAGQPDLARLRLGVTTQADTASEALEQNSLQMQEVISATLEAAVAEDDIQTSVLRLQPVYELSPQGIQGDLTGYQAINTVEIAVRDLDSLGAIVDAAVEAGGNTIEAIQFEVSESDELLAVAREAAMSDARAKAEQLAELAGVELGDVAAISEIGFLPPTPVTFETFQTADVRVPIQPGTQMVETQVQVTWQIAG